MRLARSRDAAGGITPVAASGGRWFDLSPLVADLDDQALSADSLAEIRAVIGAGRLPECRNATPRRWPGSGRSSASG